jgi:hypothetical protein
MNIRYLLNAIVMLLNMRLRKIITVKPGRFYNSRILIGLKIKINVKLIFDIFCNFRKFFCNEAETTSFV